MGTFCAKSGATLLSPVTFSKVLAGLKISCGRGFGPRLAKFIVTWTHFAQNLAQPFLCPVTFSEVLAGPPVTFSEVLGGLGGSRDRRGESFTWPRIWVSRGRGFGPRLAKFIVKWAHFAQKLARPFLSPVTLSEVLAGPPVTFSEVLGGLGGSREPFQNRRKKITVSRAVHFEGASQAV